VEADDRTAGIARPDGCELCQSVFVSLAVLQFRVPRNQVRAVWFCFVPRGSLSRSPDTVIQDKIDHTDLHISSFSKRNPPHDSGDYSVHQTLS
jgi:hypothetical protein